MERSIRFSSKATLGVCIASLESIFAMRHRKYERVQRRATRIPTGFEKFEYEDRLKKLSITTLKDRRIRGDLIEMYKVMSSRESIDWVKPLNLRKKRGYIWTSIESARKQS